MNQVKKNDYSRTRYLESIEIISNVGKFLIYLFYGQFEGNFRMHFEAIFALPYILYRGIKTSSTFSKQ